VTAEPERGAPPVQPAEEAEERQRRVFVNLVAAAFLLALAIAIVWVVMSLDEKRKLENCLNLGRRNCAELLQSTGSGG
jgi:hypothetical protein